MARRWFTWMIYVLIGLAAFYVVSQLLTNTTGFLSSIIVMVGIAAVIYGLIYFLFIRKRLGSGAGSGNTDDMKKYKQAVKQSKQKYGKPAGETTKQSKPPKKQTKKRKASPSHLRVIEGTKGKNKDDNHVSF
ncbi:SA1362 family protein [Salimicrobium flavidum]|uniref:Uncharacterized protein n=1 Tax=Salimicrobium flavidum TaxID=570947 RepID=A0A1N7IIQ3_9BACI|nr:SA1362 family protein [Salimicrobium flavidum]SIS36930.1 hypothetical protein SAMN05421687_101144 [Salimicrobium flavidum]